MENGKDNNETVWFYINKKKRITFTCGCHMHIIL